jgi:hypothetical protein
MIVKIRAWSYAGAGEKSMIKRTTISLSSAELKQLRELANEERRPVSRQIIYMMEFYKKQK